MEKVSYGARRRFLLGKQCDTVMNYPWLEAIVALLKGGKTEDFYGAVMDLLEKNYIPVISTIGCDREGNSYNINGDTAAAYVAGALGAERLIMMTDIAGILRDRNDPESLIHYVSIQEAEELKAQGIVSGGMIPKVECCVEAIRAGLKNVVIMDGRVPHSILMELLTDEGAGTMVTGDNNE